MGVYEDEFVKTVNGWQFKSIKVKVSHTSKLNTLATTVLQHKDS
ncbi:MAG TPA: hypothetical protein VMT61_09320 [Candidatus Binataceae bacterium]|nr:hypothetical protein [Candidatus Binataceae bacterium]